MIEKNLSYSAYQKKIVPYLDGSLSKEETAEFEAFVMTHPEIEVQIKTKQEEIQILKEKIPAASLTASAHESIAREIRASVFNLLKEEPKSFIDSLKIKWEEWSSR
jgi:anti-sigma factor RsiW